MDALLAGCDDAIIPHDDMWKCFLLESKCKSYLYFQVEPATKVFVTRFAPVLGFISLSDKVVRAIHRKC